MQLTGFQRADGAVGFRNHVLVLPLTGCQMTLAQRIAERVPGATCLAHPHGCDFQQPDLGLFGTFLEHFCMHPNVGGVVMLAMGCAKSLQFDLPRKVRSSGRLVESINAHHGSSRVIEEGIQAAGRMAAELAGIRRTPVPFAALTVGTKCGASDAASFTHCHPVVGQACDLLRARGATIVLSEDCELIGGIEELAARAATPEVRQKILAMRADIDTCWQARFGTTLEERALAHSTREAWRRRSLEHAAKAGNGQFMNVFDMAETVHGPGLVILNAPNTDLENVTALAAAGCNVTLFTTGRGTPVGSPASITLKITATRKTAEEMAENIDLSVADVGDLRETGEHAAGRIVAAVVDAANGRLTRAEELKHWEVAIPIRGVTY